MMRNLFTMFVLLSTILLVYLIVELEWFGERNGSLTSIVRLSKKAENHQLGYLSDYLQAEIASENIGINIPSDKERRALLRDRLEEINLLVISEHNNKQSIQCRVEFPSKDDSKHFVQITSKLTYQLFDSAKDSNHNILELQKSEHCPKAYNLTLKQAIDQCQVKWWNLCNDGFTTQQYAFYELAEKAYAGDVEAIDEIELRWIFNRDYTETHVNIRLIQRLIELEAEWTVNELNSRDEPLTDVIDSNGDFAYETSYVNIDGISN